jgi:hypothetical protein
VSVAEREVTVRVTEDGRAIAHVGLVGDRQALCGATVLGVLAVDPPARCDDCHAIWDSMSDEERTRWRERRS